jgi:single-strand DNA-binding protein
MSRSLNQCQFIGNVGSDVEQKSTPNGMAVVNLSLAVDDSYTKDGQKVEQTEWVRCVAFGKLAEIIGQYVNKGSRLFVGGKMKTRSWEQDGVKKYSTEIVLDNMLMLDSRAESAGGSASNAGERERGAAPRADTAARTQPSTFDNFDDDIPF